jgi:uncharacterized ubiquitin-like protein YukD
MISRCQYVMRVPDKSVAKKVLIAVWQCKHELDHADTHNAQIESHADRSAIISAYNSGGITVLSDTVTT